MFLYMHYISLLYTKDFMYTHTYTHTYTYTVTMFKSCGIGIKLLKTLCIQLLFFCRFCLYWTDFYNFKYVAYSVCIWHTKRWIYFVVFGDSLFLTILCIARPIDDLYRVCITCFGIFYYSQNFQNVWNIVDNLIFLYVCS